MQIVSVIDRSSKRWLRVWLSGEITSATQISILRAALGALLRSHGKGLSVDLGAVTSLSPAGVDELRRATLAAGDEGVWIEFVNARLPLHRLIQSDPVLAPVLETYAWKRPTAGKPRAQEPARV